MPSPCLSVLWALLALLYTGNYGVTGSIPSDVMEVMGSILGPNRVIAKDVKSCIPTAAMSDARH